MFMSESFSWLRGPDAEHALSDLLCGLIGDIRLILVRRDLGYAARLAAITETVNQLAPLPGQEASGAQTAVSIVALLARNAGPATILFEDLAGEQISIELVASADRRLTEAECVRLHADPGAYGHHRTGRLRTVHSGLVAAEVHSVVVPGRLPASARRILGIRGTDEPAPPPSGVPLGKALAGLGVRREPLGARLVRHGTGAAGDRVSVESSARMWLGDVPVALAGERVTAEFCQRAVDRLPSVRAAVASSLLARR
jgi:hypothetical protein